MATYKVPIRVVFDGEVTVEANDPFEAEQIAQGLDVNLGETDDGGYKQIVDWCVAMKPMRIETDKPQEGE